MDTVLFKLAAQRKICSFFDLPEDMTEFERDAHYPRKRIDAYTGAVRRAICTKTGTKVL